MDLYTGYVISNNPIGNLYYRLRIKCPKLAEVVKEGQIIHVRCGIQTDPLLRRPFSIYRYNKTEGEIELLYFIKGKGTRIMKNLKPNDAVDIMGPTGSNYKISDNAKGIALLGRGTGIASIVSIGEKAREKGLYTLAILSGRTPDHIIGKDFLNCIGCDVHSLYDSNNSSSVENLNSILRNAIESKKIDEIFVCGSKRMGMLVNDLCREFGLTGYISLEEHMACGIGVCKGCACKTRHGYKTICQDGPVFPIEEVFI